MTNVIEALDYRKWRERKMRIFNMTKVSKRRSLMSSWNCFKNSYKDYRVQFFLLVADAKSKWNGQKLGLRGLDIEKIFLSEKDHNTATGGRIHILGDFPHLVK